MKRIAALLLLACLAAEAHAFDSFVVSEIRIDGLQRIAPGTVFTYLPVEKGDRITADAAEKAIRALFKTGFFNDVQLSRQGDILVVTVQERPAISKITLKGNKELKEEELRKGEAALRASGAVAETGNVKILTSCPSCLQGLSRYGGDLQNGLLEADYIVVEMANQILGKEWLPAYVEAANHGGIERVLV